MVAHQSTTQKAGRRRKSNGVTLSGIVVYDEEERQRATVIPIFLRLFDEFERLSISYCYWKSSRRLHAVLRGESDLDLLVATSDRQCCEAILVALGFKRFTSVAFRQHASVQSYLGYDEHAGCLLHVHLYCRLIVGEPLLQNYRIPWERALLGRSIRAPDRPVRIIDPESEAVLLIVRSCLERSMLDPLSMRDRRMKTRRLAQDRRRLAAILTRNAVSRRASELLNDPLASMVTAELFGESSRTDIRALRRALKRHFRPYRTYNAPEARMRSISHALFCTAGRLNRQVLHFMRPWNRRAPGGGHVIAIVGLDGSGKSTLVSAMRCWLGEQIDIVPVYFGTGDGRPSLLMWPFKLVAFLIAPLIKTKPKGASHGRISEREPGLLYSMFLLVWAAAVAMDKRQKLVAARRGADRGLVIISDRYPQNESQIFNDGPMLARAPLLPDWVRRLESRPYDLARRFPPDLVIKLIVSEETAACREPNMNLDIIRERIAVLERLQFGGAPVVCVNAERPLLEVIRDVRGEIWRML
jgi:thymidylate kinase